MNELKTKIVLRNDITANWEQANPVLLAGEVGVEFLLNGSIRSKIGDGITPWVELPYATGDGLGYRYCGQVETFFDLPHSALVGDVYNIRQGYTPLKVAPGDNVVWTGDAWRKLIWDIDTSQFVTIDQIANNEQAGLIKGSDNFSLNENGEVTNINFNLIKQDELDVLYLNCNYGGVDE